MFFENFFSEFFRTIIIMSITGGVLSLLLILLKPLVRHRLPKSAQYFLWLLVLGAFIVPISQIVTMPEAAPIASPIHSVVGQNVISQWEDVDRQIATPTLISPMPSDFSSYRTFLPTPAPSIQSVIVTIFMFIIYPVTILIIFFYNFTGYARFVAKLKRGYTEPDPTELSLLKELTKNKKAPRLMKSIHAPTPMLIGIFKPVIVLPNGEYSADQLRAIYLHELTHMRRHDVLVKWLSLLTCALHWFNPLIWLTRKEIDRACELACDEAVIREMDASGKQAYGDTLIAVASSEKIPLPVVSTTMSAQKKAIKERLTSIMKNKKYTKTAVLASGLMILAVIFTACALGASGGNDNGEILDNSPRHVGFYADLYIQELIDGLVIGYFPDGHDGDFYTAEPNIIETRINTLELVAEIDNHELWRLDFMLQTDDVESETIRWGTFAPDEDGWVGHHTGWNDARTLLVFDTSGDSLSFLGVIPWYMEENPDGIEGALREFLGTVIILEPIPFVGAAHETQRIVDALPLPGFHMSLRSIQIGADHGGFGYGDYTLTIHYSLHTDTLPVSPVSDFTSLAHSLFELIGNLEAVTFSVVSVSETDADNYIMRWSTTKHVTNGDVTTFNTRLTSRASSGSIYIAEIPPNTGFPIARLIMGGDNAYTVEVTHDSGNITMFSGLRQSYEGIITMPTGGLWFYYWQNWQNPHVTTKSRFLDTVVSDGIYYLYVGSLYSEPLTNVDITITATGSNVGIEFLRACERYASPHVVRVGADYVVYGLGGRIVVHLGQLGEIGSMPRINFIGSGFPVPRLEAELIEGSALLTQDSIRVTFAVSRNDIILEHTDGPLGTVAGPVIEFEYVSGMGITIELRPFEFYNNRHEPLFFEFTEEGAIALAHLLLQALYMVDDYRN